MEKKDKRKRAKGQGHSRLFNVNPFSLTSMRPVVLAVERMLYGLSHKGRPSLSNTSL